MSDRTMTDRNPQISITLGQQVYDDFTVIAAYLGLPRATLIADVVNEYHRSPSFSSLLKRAKEKEQAKENPSE